MMSTQLFALTAPLITTSSGRNGQDRDRRGVVNADLVSPYDYWQYWRNNEDGDGPLPQAVHRASLPEIGRLAALKDHEINEAKKVLATEATAMVHGRTAAEEAANTAGAPSRKVHSPTCCRRSRSARRARYQARRACRIRPRRPRLRHRRGAASDQGAASG